MKSPYSLTSKLGFGKYSGRTIENIWTGHSPISKEKVIRQYLQEFFELFNGVNKPQRKFVTSDSLLDSCENSLEYLNTKNVFLNVYVAKNHLIIREYIDEHLPHLCNVIHGLLSGSYNKMTQNVYNSGDNIPFSQSSLNIIGLFADPSYIDWAINSIDDFFLVPSDIIILGNRQSSRFLGFELLDVCEDVIEFKSIFRDFNFQLGEETIHLNAEKYNRWIEDQQVNSDYWDYDDRKNSERESFEALTDGQYGDYEDWNENNRDLSDLRDNLGL